MFFVCCNNKHTCVMQHILFKQYIQTTKDIVSSTSTCLLLKDASAKRRCLNKLDMAHRCRCGTHSWSLRLQTYVVVPSLVGRTETWRTDAGGGIPSWPDSTARRCPRRDATGSGKKGMPHRHRCAMSFCVANKAWNKAILL